MKITIVVPVHNALEHVETLLQRLPKTEAAYCDQIFVDDASALGVKDTLLRYALDHNNVSVLRNDKQQLFTRTLNRGIRSATPDTDFILGLNTDCVVSPGFINVMIEAFEKFPNAAVVGYPDGVPQDAGFEVVNHPSYVTGHCIMIPMPVLRKFGVFCETDLNQAHISSERLWFWNVNSKGYCGVYVHRNLVVHDSGGPSWKRDLGWLARFDYSKLWPGRDTL